MHAKIYSQENYYRFSFSSEHRMSYGFLASADSVNDSTRSVVFKEQFVKRSSSPAMASMEEVGLGFIIGSGVSFSLGFIAGKIYGQGDSWSGLGAFVYGASAGYLIGYPYGIYRIAKNENPEISYWEILASELVGLGTGFGINIMTDHKGAGHWTPFVFPLIFPIIYVELVK